MSTNCEACGYKDNEVKSGSAISAQGKKITLKVEDLEDLSRDILKVPSLCLDLSDSYANSNGRASPVDSPSPT